jgi:predicted nucleic acid-binding protein
MRERSFFDTNILIYRDDANTPDKRDTAIELLETSWRENDAVISTQVLQEYFVAATRKLGVKVETARRKVQLFGGMAVVNIIQEDIVNAIDLHRLHAFSFWDALIVTAAQKGACRILYSEDMQHGQKLGDVTIVNPFL